MENTHYSFEILQQYVQMRLSQDDEFGIQEHLAECDECANIVHKLRLITQKNQRLHEEWVEQHEKVNEAIQTSNPVTTGKIREISFRRVLAYAAILLPIIFFIGGGISYLLIDTKYDSKFIDLIRDRDSLLKDNNNFLRYEIIYKSEIAKLNEQVKSSNPNPKIIFVTPKEELKKEQKNNNFKPDSLQNKLGNTADSFKSTINSDLVGVVSDLIFWKEDSIQFFNNSRFTVHLKIIGYNNFEKEIKMETKSKHSILLNKTGVYMYKFFDNKHSEISQGKFYVVNKRME